jgi:16S rRNA G966 N2-methylase RsmD
LGNGSITHHLPLTTHALKIFTYIKYFFYLAWNWNIPIAVFIIYHEIKGEKKYRIHTSGYDELKHLQEKGIDLSHSTIYMPANYYMLEKMMSEINKLTHTKTFLDIGCGKGRAMAVAAHHGFKKITGIDISKKFVEETRQNLAVVQQQFPGATFDVLMQDAFYYQIPVDISVIFIFNPFDEVIMSGVVENILISQEKNPRTIWVIYINPLYENLFLDNGFVKTLSHKKLNWLQGAIFEKRI